MSDQTIRILLVEDDDTDREVVERFVRKEQLHYDLQTTASMAEALEQLRDGAYDIVLLDYKLGDGTGLEVLPHVGDTPTIFITGHGSEQIAVEAMRNGAYDYLIKDLDRNYLKVLPSTIKNVLERKRLQTEKDNLIHELQEAFLKVKTLSGFLPICANCKKIRDDKGYWNQIEEYIRDHSEAEFNHGICPECVEKLYPRLNIYKD